MSTVSARRRALISGFLVLTCLAARASAAALCDGISPASDSPLTTVRVASGIWRPTFVTAPPGDTERLFIVEQDGRIRLLKNGILQPTPFLDVSALVRSPATGGNNEEGLLGLAFHPGYATNGWFFIYHTDAAGNNQVARYERSAVNADQADSTSRQGVISFSHPLNGNHNGGMIVFGPDGQLYIGTGDGGGFCDANANAQNPLSYLGKIHRINVDALPYKVPADNPFAGVAGYLPEIWALGLRNPWRYSFDRGTGDLYIGDVGELAWEEIDTSPAPNAGGQNYGWARYEGDTCPNISCGGQGSCTVAGYVGPVVTYGHSSGCSVTGGYVYRGCRMPNLRGTYFYADYCTAFIRSFRYVGGTITSPIDRTVELAPGAGLDIRLITSFGEDARGEMYILERGGATPTGEVFKIVPTISSLEVSGPGAASFLLGAPDWMWEDLGSTSSHPIVAYKVYRQTVAGGDFTCVHQSATPSWTGGDPENPGDELLYSYVITAVNPDGKETSPGTGSNGTPRVLALGACP